MKQAFLILSAVVIFNFSFAQSGTSPKTKKAKYGFNFGLNYTDIHVDGKLPDHSEAHDNLGIRLGIISDFKLTNIISVAPKAELAFNAGQIGFKIPNQKETGLDIMTATIDFMTHFVFKDNTKDIKPYFFFGPDIKIPLHKQDNTTNFNSNKDFAFDFGIGLDKTYTHFNVAPELRYSYGLLDVTKHPSFESIHMHNISFIFNFIG